MRPIRILEPNRTHQVFSILFLSHDNLLKFDDEQRKFKPFLIIIKHARDRDRDYFDCDDQLKKEIGKNASPLGYLPY